MTARISFLAPAVLVSCASFYGVGLYAGAVSLIGYETRSERLQGFRSTGGPTVKMTVLPVYLRAGQAIAAHYDVNAAKGSVQFSVAPVMFQRTFLQVAHVQVAGRHQGGVLFVAKQPGWYTFWSDPSPLGGPRCPGKPDMLSILVGRADCPAYDVDYQVTWRLAPTGRPAAETATVMIPGANERFVTLTIGG